MKRVGRWVGFLVLVVLVAADAVPLAGAAPSTTASKQQRQTEINKRLGTLRSQVQDASAAEAALLEQLDAVEDKRKELDAKVAALDAQVASAQGELDAAQGALTQLVAELSAAQAELNAAQRLLIQARRRLAERAVRAYMGQPGIETADRFLQPGSQREMAAAESYVETLVEAQQDLVDQYDARQRALQAREAAVQTHRDESQAQRDLVAQRTAEVQAARRVQAGARAEVVAQERQKETLVAQVRSRKREFETQIAQLRAESNAIAAFLRGAQRGQGPAISGKGILAPPIPGAAITSTFGSRTHPIYGDVRMHNGIDFRAATGTAVRAAGAGKILYAGWKGGYGNAVIIDHGNSLATLYAHLSGITVGVGQGVAKGQMVGRAGSTGMSTGPHLHLEVRANGVPVNPLGYL